MHPDVGEYRIEVDAGNVAPDPAARRTSAIASTLREPRMRVEYSNSVEDRLAIKELKQRYAIHINMHETDEWVGLFTVDAVFDGSEFDNPLSRGHEEIRAYGQTLVKTVQYALHHTTTHVVSDLTATGAEGIAFSIVEYMLKDGFLARTQVVYRDRYAKVGGRWLIAQRVLKRTLPTEVLNGISE